MSNRRITSKNVNRDGNRYCGPLVIAALLGCTTAEAAAKVREANNTDRAIKGLFNSELLRTLSANGYKVSKLEVPKRYQVNRMIGERAADAVEYTTKTWSILSPGKVTLWRPDNDDSIGGSAMTPVKLVGLTLAGWLKQRPDKAGVYVVNVTGHYVLVAGRKFVDTATRGEWVSIGKAPHRRCRVENVWEVSR